MLCFKRKVNLKVILLLYCFTSVDYIFAQGENLLEISTGTAWRSPMFFFLSTGTSHADDTHILFIIESNTDGVSFTPGVRLNKSKVTLESYMSIKRDVLYGSKASKTLPFVKSWLFDSNTNLIIHFNKISVGLGVGFLNINESYHYYRLRNYDEGIFRDRRHLKIDYTTLNLLLEKKIRVFDFPINVQLLAHYVPKDLPTEPIDDHISYSIRIFHNFKIIE